MALAQRIESLQKRRLQIKEKLKNEEKRLAPDMALLRQMKLENLTLKDEINRLMKEGSGALA